MAKTPEKFQDDKTRPAPETSKDSGPRLQPRWKDEARADDDEDELFNDMPV